MPSPTQKTGYALDSSDDDVPGSPNFESKIDGMLKEGNIVVTAATRSALHLSLKLAWLDGDMEQEDKRAAPAALFRQLDASVQKTQGLMRRIEKYSGTKSIGCDMCAVGDGTVEVATFREMKFGKTLSVKHEVPFRREKGDATVGKKAKPKKIRARQVALDSTLIVMVSRFRMLARLHQDIARRQPNRKRGNQPERDKSAIVARAALFFRQYSTEKLTNYYGGPFARFCRNYYVTVTRSRLSPRGLQKTIRAEIRNPTFS
jgi:hypothetical protein